MKKNKIKRIIKITYIIITILNISLLFYLRDYTTCASNKEMNIIATISLIVFIITSIIYGVILIKSKKTKYTIILLILLILSIFMYINFLKNEIFIWDCVTIDKPMIYIYPTEDDTNIKINLSENNLITHSYPKYEKEWDVIVSKNGNIYDSKTNRNYYGLYWEGIDNTKVNTKEGFIIKGEDTISFLEEKLEILGLNEREANEFIVYWLPKLENNKYNFIRFRTIDEINAYMKINTNVKVDTLIRIYMDYKPLNKPYDIKEQTLKKQTREGFTIVEWGGRELK